MGARYFLCGIGKVSGEARVLFRAISKTAALATACKVNISDSHRKRGNQKSVLHWDAHTGRPIRRRLCGGDLKETGQFYTVQSGGYNMQMLAILKGDCCTLGGWSLLVAFVRR